jgi:hypothetical protein
MSRIRVEQIVRRQGQPITYKRLTGVTRNETTLQNTNTYTTHSLVGYFRLFKDRELTHLIQQGDREVRLPAHSMTFVPKFNDRILLADGRSYNVVGVDERYFGGSAGMYILHLRGDDGAV